MQSSVAKGHYRLLATSALGEHAHRTHAVRREAKGGGWRRESQNKMNVICGRGNARQRQRAYWSVEVESQPRESEHRESRDGRARAAARSQEPGTEGALCDQSMSTPHWSSKCRSPLDDNKFPFNRIYLKFLFLFLAAAAAATHTQLHLHLYYSTSTSLTPSQLVAILHDCCGFYSSRVALAPNSFLPFHFYCF